MIAQKISFNNKKNEIFQIFHNFIRDFAILHGRWIRIILQEKLACMKHKRISLRTEKD